MSQPTRAKVQRLADAGHTPAEIADRLTTPESTVRRLLGDNAPSRNGKGNIARDDRTYATEEIEIREIPSAPGYGVSDDGRVWSLKSNPPYMMTPKINNSRHGQPLLRVRLSVNGRVSDRYIAQLVAEVWLPPRPLAAVLGYRDDDRANVVADNLVWLESAKTIHVPDSEFVTVWQTSHTMQEATDRLGISVAAAYVRSCNFRKKGVPLKFLGHKDISLDELIRLAEETGEPQ